MAGLEEQQLNVRNLLQGRIFRGELPAGTRIDENLLRRETGATVRAVRGALRELTADGILKRKQRQGTFVSLRLPAGMSAPLPALTSVAVITSLVHRTLDQSTFTRDIIAGIRSRLASPANIQIIAHDSGNHDITDIPVFDASALAQTAQGVLGLEANNAAVLNELVRDGVAVVAIDFWSPRSQFDVLTVDHEDSGYLATEHLLSLGHRVIGFIGESPNLKSSDPTWQARLTGYMRAMVAGGDADFARWILGVQRDATLIPPRLPDFHRKIKATAYVLCSGGLLPKSLQVFEEMGLRCPEHISLSCADGSVPHLGRPATSHVVVDFEEVGRMALRVLASRLACRSMPAVRLTLPVTFLPGCTTARINT